MANGNSTPDDPIRREAFSQSCQMYRHFVMMRYYALATFAFITAALIALYFSYRTLDGVQNWVIRIIGGVIALACVGFELRIARLIDFFDEKSNEYAKELKINAPIIPPPYKYKYITVATALSILIYLATAVAWIGFAYPPPPASK